MLFNGPESSESIVILAHGAGAPMDSPFMNRVAEGLAAESIRVARFEFPYMAARRTSGKRGAPDREPVLRESWARAVDEVRAAHRYIFIGGKSMGGRIATMVADELSVHGVIALGYPFHPPGQLEKLRTAHLKTLRTPTLIVQGTRDTFGTREEVESYELSPSIEIVWIEGGDHSFKPGRGSGSTERENVGRAVEAGVGFVVQLSGALD